MYFSSVLLTTLLFASRVATAAPPSETDTDINGNPQAELDLDAPAEDMTAHEYKWTIRSMRRTCNHHDTLCEWFFYIDTGFHDRHPTKCHFFVEGHRASRTDTQGNMCGRFTVSSGWSGHFGPGKGFTVLSVIDQVNKLIAWPGYTDKQLEACKTVKPDLAFPVSRLPGF